MSDVKYWTYWTDADKREKEVEDSLRKRYCNSDENCKDGDALLVDISEQPLLKKESPYARLFAKSSASKSKPYVVGDKVTVTCDRLEEILESYFCCNILKDFSNIVLAGGMIVSCLDAQTGGTAFASSPYLDADFFVYGLNPDGVLSQKEVRDKFDDIVRRFIDKLVKERRARHNPTPKRHLHTDPWGVVRRECNQDESHVVMLRTEDSITLLIPCIHGIDAARGIYPLNVQIILRDYRDKFHILSGFDIPACAVLYDGQKVLALPRAVTALERQENLVDTQRQSLTFESRLLKYQTKKGLSIVVPGADIKKLMVGALLDLEDTEKTCGGLVRLILSMIKGSQQIQQNESSSYCVAPLKVDMEHASNFADRVYNSVRSSLKNGRVRHIVMASVNDIYRDRTISSETILAMTMDKCARHIYDILIAKDSCVVGCTRTPAHEPVPAWVSDPTILKRGDANSFRPTSESNWFTGAECMLE